MCNMWYIYILYRDVVDPESEDVPEKSGPDTYIQVQMRRGGSMVARLIVWCSSTGFVSGFSSSLGQILLSLKGGLLEGSMTQYHVLDPGERQRYK
jgi:hypothetical protein